MCGDCMREKKKEEAMAIKDDPCPAPEPKLSHERRLEKEEQDANQWAHALWGRPAAQSSFRHLPRLGLVNRLGSP